jgi:hypothetical protein
MPNKNDNEISKSGEPNITIKSNKPTNKANDKLNSKTKEDAPTIIPRNNNTILTLIGLLHFSGIGSKSNNFIKLLNKKELLRTFPIVDLKATRIIPKNIIIEAIIIGKSEP